MSALWFALAYEENLLEIMIYDIESVTYDSGKLSIVEYIHPFPARMAPELVNKEFASVPAGSTILDPMCGLGTIYPLALTILTGLISQS